MFSGYYNFLYVGYNISDTLATYMLIAMDPSIIRLTSFFTTLVGEAYSSLLDKYDAELQGVMTTYGFKDLLQLYKAVAFR